MLSTLPEELSFIHEMMGDRKEQYRSADWLRSPFNSKIWECNFGDAGSFILDFRVRLEDGTLLTAQQNCELLETIKCWLCVQTHPDSTGGKVLTKQVYYNRATRTLFLIDWFLLNSSRCGLACHGLKCITKNDILQLISDLMMSNEVINSIYRWPERLSTFLREKISSVSQKDIEQVSSLVSAIKSSPDDTEDRFLMLDESEITLARVWLWKSNFYKKGMTKTGFMYTPNTLKLSNVIYRDTLRGKSSKPVPKELCLDTFEAYAREFPAVSVRTNNEEKLNAGAFSVYLCCLRNLGLLEELNLSPPLEALSVLDTIPFRELPDLKGNGRFRTLPQSLVFKALRDSIEFALKYGDFLIDAYIAIIKAVAKTGLTCQSYCKEFGVQSLLPRQLKELGISYWSLGELFAPNCEPSTLTRLKDNETYYSMLRSNQGFLELLKVLYGSIAVCVGTLMARRSGEITKLVAKKSLDQSGAYLVFYNCKSGHIGTREKEARPIPAIASRMIQMIERLQTELINLDVIDEYKKLFAFPKISGKGLTSLGADQFNSLFDIFCDYTETLCNDCGQRYYIRQHQLRRFFAILFFWGNSFGGMDTLRWFLGHTDVEHLYNYITEVTSGDALKFVKASYAAEQVKAQSKDSAALADLLEKRFCIRDFSILDQEELQEYIEDLLGEGRVEIEPEFFETHDGKRNRVLIKVRHRDSQKSKFIIN